MKNFGLIREEIKLLREVQSDHADRLRTAGIVDKALDAAGLVHNQLLGISLRRLPNQDFPDMPSATTELVIVHQATNSKRRPDVRSCQIPVAETLDKITVPCEPFDLADIAVVSRMIIELATARDTGSLRHLSVDMDRITIRDDNH